MPIPWLRILNAVIGASDLARVLRGRSASEEQLAVGARSSGPLEARLAGVVVAALKEAFDRDHQRMELEREQIEADRLRAERALRLELVRRSADQEIGRQRLLGGAALVGWLATLFLVTSLPEASAAARVAVGAGWLLLLAAIGASFSAQSKVAQWAARLAEDTSAATLPSGAEPASAALWLMVAGLAAIGVGVLL